MDELSRGKNKGEQVYKNLSRQGKWASILGAVTVLNAILSFVYVTQKTSKSVSALLLGLIGVLLVTVPWAVYQIYAINCVVKGGCEVLSWILIAVIVLTNFIHLPGLVFAGKNKW